MFFFLRFLQLKSFVMSIRVSHKINLPRVHWDEPESRSTIAGGCTTFSLTKRSPLQLPSVFFCHEAF